MYISKKENKVWVSPRERELIKKQYEILVKKDSNVSLNKMTDKQIIEACNSLALFVFQIFSTELKAIRKNWHPGFDISACDKMFAKFQDIGHRHRSFVLSILLQSIFSQAGIPISRAISQEVDRHCFELMIGHPVHV